MKLSSSSTCRLWACRETARASDARFEFMMRLTDVDLARDLPQAMRAEHRALMLARLRGPAQ
jgi:hypothetical protein